MNKKVDTFVYSFCFIHLQQGLLESHIVAQKIPFKNFSFVCLTFQIFKSLQKLHLYCFVGTLYENQQTGRETYFFHFYSIRQHYAH